MSGPIEVKRGLAGVTADASAVSVVDEESGSLLYRGYPVPDLAASCSFEEVAYLIWHGELPNETQLEKFEAAERSRRQVPTELSLALSGLPLTCHPMDVLRTAVSYLGAAGPNGGRSLDRGRTRKIVRPMGQAADHCRRRTTP